MARTLKSWYWKERKSWYVTIRGERHNLGPDKGEAYREFHRLMSTPEHAPLRGGVVVVLIDRFLEWVQRHRAADTYNWYQYRLQLFARRYPDLAVDDLRPFHVQDWIDSYPNLAPGSRRNLARAIQGCLRWCEKQGFIDRSPIAHFEKPSGGVREFVISPETYATIPSAIPGQPFRDLVVFAWETGARAAECLVIEGDTSTFLDTVSCCTGTTNTPSTCLSYTYLALTSGHGKGEWMAMPSAFPA